jgi:hypothetical protein
MRSHHPPLRSLVVSLLGAALFAAFLIYDIQLIMAPGGSRAHAYRVSVDDHILAVITLYLDIVNLFLHILRALSEMRRD